MDGVQGADDGAVVTRRKLALVIVATVVVTVVGLWLAAEWAWRGYLASRGW